MRRSFISHAFAWAVGVFLFSSARAADPVLPPALKAQVQAILQTSQSAGAAVILVDALGVSAAYWHGDVRAGTCHSAGAAGDALVAMVAMRLAERGKADLYASLPPSLSKSLGMPTAAVCKGKNNVSLSHLLEHSSGLGGPPTEGRICSASRTAYSAWGISLAALALEKTTQTSMNALMKREVFAPLAMDSSNWSLGISATSADSNCDGATNLPKAGLITTPHDMANLVQMLVQRGQVEAKPYLPQCAIERMGISVSGASMLGGNTTAAIDRAEYGLGLQRFKVDGKPWLGYSGDSQDSRWVWGFSSQSQTGMVIVLGHDDAIKLAALKTAVATFLQKDAAKVVANSR